MSKGGENGEAGGLVDKAVVEGGGGGGDGEARSEKEIKLVAATPHNENCCTQSVVRRAPAVMDLSRAHKPVGD